MNKENLIKKIFKGKRPLVIILILLVGGFFWWRSKILPGKVETIEVKRGEVLEELTLSGEIKADEHAELKFQLSGELAWIGVAEGDWVKRGQKLAGLDATSLDADLQIARASLRSAEATAERVLDDVKNHEKDETYTQRETRTTAEVARDKAYDAVRKAEENLKNATLKSPIDGLVTYVGTPFSRVNVLSTQTQFEIVNPATIYFEVAADQSEVIDLYEGQKVTVILDSFPKEEFEGEVKFIGYTPKTDELGAVYRVKVDFLNAGFDASRFRIGMTGDATFTLSEKEDVLYVPPKFIKSDGSGKYIRLGAKNNKVYVETGIESEERVEVVGNVHEGDIVYY